jgi:hypothetical protein
MNTLSRHSARGSRMGLGTQAQCRNEEENGVSKKCIDLEICSLSWFLLGA